MPGADPVREAARLRPQATEQFRDFALFPPAASDDCYVRINSDSLHELMGPTNQIGTLVELLRQKYAGVADEDTETLFGFLQSAAGRLQTMMAGFKTYLRAAACPTERRLCDANQLLAGAKASIGPMIEESGAVVTHDPLPEVDCDASQICYAFASLLENAIKFRGAQRAKIHVSAVSEGEGWVFSVHDNGIGIEPRFRDRIFALFKRARNDNTTGAGVGLAATRQIVEQHGGRIWVDSQPGMGTTFYFSLRQAG